MLLCVCLYVCLFVRLFVSVCMLVCLCVCLCVSVCLVDWLMGTFPENPSTRMTILGNKRRTNVDLALTLAMWERQRESLCENENSMSSFNQKCCLFIKNVVFSLEICRFGAKNGVLHYVLK